MPELSRFFGIVIAMYYRDHEPAHFHAIHGEFEAIVEIETGRVHGQLPARALEYVIEWRWLHRTELLGAWKNARAHEPLPRIAPLDRQR